MWAPRLSNNQGETHEVNIAMAIRVSWFSSFLFKLTKLRGQLNEQAIGMDGPNFDRILVADDRFCYTLGLRRRRTHFLEGFESNNPAIDIKRHEYTVGVFLNSADVVEETGKQPRLVTELPLGEVLSGNRETWPCRKT